MCSIPLLKARGQCTVFSSVAAQSSLRSSVPCWVSGRCDGAMQTSVEPSPCRSISPCSAELPVPCCAPCTFLWAALAHSDPFRSDFSLKAGMLSGKKGGAPTCQNGIAACVLLQSLGSLYSSESLDFLFFFKLLRKPPALKFSLYMKMHKSSFIFPASDFNKNLWGFLASNCTFVNNGDSNIPKQF